ncbi:uncharacterized protein LOC116852538 [Odontomachus brunneus]|uniref:uncharacterized protein LOC116852538 n=1 Tax=Odontomachus brunneus TaxID=486640 RepID=UPI0013F1E54D|nr:uncharacterized protein LOC116852538 [Odontomachus brunneus]
MWLYLVVLILLSSTVLARYHEKTRFDRSIHEEIRVKNTDVDHFEKKWSFTDDVTEYVAYKSKVDNDCYLENIKQDRDVRKKRQTKILYASTVLTKLEAWRLAGGRIVDFCNGRNFILLETNKPILGQTLDPFLNEIPVDENDISSRRVADVVLTPLISRTRREIQLEQREILNKKFGRFRQRRQTNQFRGKFRGQTQSQYLNIGSGEQKEGKAEAESTQQASRAVVSGSRGMGQAQSMSSGGTGCEDCPGYPGVEIPDKLRIPSADGDRFVQGVGTPGIRRPGTGIVPGGIPYPGGITPGAQITYPGGVVPGGVGTYPGVLPGTRPGTYPGVQPDIITPTGDGTYPGGVQPGVIQPGTVTPSGDGTYPGGVRPGVVTPGGDGTYPGGVRPGIMIPGGDRTYPGGVRPGVVTPGGDGTYPGGVRPGVVTPGGDGTYPGGVRPGVVTPGGDGIYPGGVRPGVVTPGGDGIYPGGVRPGVVTPGGDGIYPAVRPGVVIPSGDGKYPPGTLITGGPGTYPGGIQPGGVLPGTTTTGIGTGVGTYPGSIQPGIQPGQVTYPSGGVITSVTTGATIIGTGTYPSGITPGTGQPGGIYPGATLPIGRVETYPGTGIPSVQPGTVSGTYPGGVPGTVVGQGVYPSGVQQTGAPYPGGVTTYPVGPGGLVPGMVPTTGSIADGGTQVISYPGGRPIDGQAIYPAPGSVIQPGRIPDGTGGTQITTYPSTGTYPAGQVIYPSGTQQVIPPSGTLYPGQQIFPGDGRQTYPGQLYPGTSVGIPGTAVPGRTVVPGGIQYPISTTGGQPTIGRTGVTEQYPGQYPSRIGGQVIGAPYPGVSETGIDGTYTQIGAGRPTGVADDNAESQASSSVQQEGSDTQASASAQGRYGQGTAQSQVTGTYSGSGSFSAQAGTSDANKGAQTEVSGGKEGATSNAQGVGGYGKSQAQVQLNSDSGATSTGAQSSGWNHGTNSQVQASSKGGMADAQANGEGSTSSQAQIGFQPYLKTDEKPEEHDSLFRGSGTASAQSGTHRGQSQSQLQGSFQYGITYTGAAQAGSGSGAASSRKPFSFNMTETELFKPFKPQNPSRKLTNVGNAQSSPTSPTADYEDRQNREQGLQSSSTSRQTVVIGSKNNPEDPPENKKVLATEKSRTDDPMYDEYDNDYADEYYDTTATTTTLTTTTTNPMSNGAKAFTHQRDKVKTAQRQNQQTQVMHVIKGDRYDIHVNQDSNSPRTSNVLQPGQSLMGYTVPPGFRGRVMSISGTETIAQGDGKSQSQTVSLVPKNSTSTKPSATEVRSLQTNHERHVDRHTSSSKSQASPSFGQGAISDRRTRPVPTSIAIKPSYYTVSNSVAGKMNGSNAQKQYEHRYYTKSSTCGYFTFSCNVVYGSNGRTKICKPKAPTYPDGTPMRC